MSISFQLISRYLAGDASKSNSGDESGGDADDGEPKESPKVESENQDDDKLDDSKYKKTVDDIQPNYCGALPNFRTQIQRRSLQCRECPAETTSETTDRGVQDQRCTAISMSGTRRGKICSLSGCLKNHARTHRRDRQSLTSSHQKHYILILENQFIHNKPPLIKPLLCYLPHIETIKHNNDLENHAVCRGNQHCLYYVLKLGKQHSTGVEYPSSCNTRQAEHVSATSDTRRPEKTSPISAQEIWVGTKVGCGCGALLLGP